MWFSGFGAAVWLLCVSVISANSFEGNFPSLAEVTLEDLQDGLSQGLFTSVDLVKAYLARIEEVNGILQAVTETNPEALKIAKGLDEERKAGVLRGALHGIPIIVKNTIATDDQMNNTAGSYALLGTKVPSDSTLVSKLRAAGAILLGKANLSQWANARSTNSSDGWSAYGGQCNAAYYPYQDAGGSSSGSAVISSIGLSFATLGTDTIGSILSPADSNNVVGFRPTLGLTSRHLVIPYSLRQDTVGPLARTVTDAAAVLNVIAGPDPADNYTTVNPHPDLDYSDFDRDYNKTLKNARIGVPANIMEIYTAPWFDTSNTSQPVADAFYTAVSLLKDHGATVNLNANYSRLDDYYNIYSNGSASYVVLADIVSDMEQYLSLLEPQDSWKPQTLEDIRNFTRLSPLEDYPDRDTGGFDAALLVPSADSAFIWNQYQQNLQIGGEGGPVGALESNDLDVIMVPTQAAEYFTCIAGLPAISVPLGFYPADQEVVISERSLVQAAPGVPFGIAFIGRLWDEMTLLKYAYAFEQVTQIQRTGKPYILPRTEISHVI